MPQRLNWGKNIMEQLLFLLCVNYNTMFKACQPAFLLLTNSFNLSASAITASLVGICMLSLACAARIWLANFSNSKRISYGVIEFIYSNRKPHNALHYRAAVAFILKTICQCHSINDIAGFVYLSTST